MVDFAKLGASGVALARGLRQRKPMVYIGLVVCGLCWATDRPIAFLRH